MSGMLCCLVVSVRNSRTRFAIRILCQIIQTNAGVIFEIVRVDKTLAVSVAVEECDARGTSAGLHGSPCLEACDAVGWYALVVELGVGEVSSVGIVSG